MKSESQRKQPAPRRTDRQMAKERRGARAMAVIDRPPVPQGWDTSDEHEIELRRWRGRTDVVAIRVLEPDQSAFGTFQARSESGIAYEVEIRTLDGFENSCGCVDHRVNGLGTCKHVEGVLAGLRRRGARAFRQAASEGSPRIELFLRRQGDPSPSVAWPRDAGGRVAAVKAWLAPWLDQDDRLVGGYESIESLADAVARAPAEIRGHLRLSRHFGPWLARCRRERSRRDDKAAYLADIERGRASFDLLRSALLPYQREGMMHLAFGERALLADDMGLGKTIQAIAACELLARRKGIERVLVVCPASLKTEWEEQVARFTDRKAQAVFGPRATRLGVYAAPSFFTIVNYEQVVIDAYAINEELAPDVVILDEAQRIKNWQTKTARKVKALRSDLAFVLTGTPVENRIDELYSIVQFLDPELVGPLFRFNRSFYQLDERGRPIDYRNLDELRQRVQPVLLRRRKSDVESELPGRSVKTYLVPMAGEQRLRYDEYRENAARLASIARRRPLTPAEFEKLQRFLACMRMICDTPAILDPRCRVCPKLEELEGVLGDLLAEPDRKVIIFSEWERMLQMVRELATEMGVEVAWHTGSVPQLRRREEINRFKHDPDCRLFLSTDSGSVGLNLQAASAVVNIDLPWNPAKLEQRIARAWRKHQTRSVTVINLVTESSIEHAMLQLLTAKQALADGLLDGVGDVGGLKMPSGRGALIERMRSMLEEAEQVGPRIVSGEEAVCEDLRHRHGGRVLRVEVRSGPEGAARMLAVLDLDAGTLAEEAERLGRREDGAPAVEVVDRATWLTLRRLAGAGILTLSAEPCRVLHVSPELADAAPDAQRAQAGASRVQAERAVRMATALAAGGLAEEVPSLLDRALRCAIAARQGRDTDADHAGSVIDLDELRRLVGAGLPRDAERVLSALRPGAGTATAEEAAELVRSAGRLVAALCSGEIGAAERVAA